MPLGFITDDTTNDDSNGGAPTGAILALLRLLTSSVSTGSGATSQVG
ncbi:hypothetical protein GCM10023094_51150 [Rhodococcus olei]|uniref:Uncharacterized protein n=1 Tax=Rhodococcus olei TaxID=2161675 RepID=A0ABP8PQI3_9NOCA